MQVEGKRECIIKDDFKVPILKEGRKMVIDSKVRKMARFGDEKKSLIVNIFHIPPSANKCECSQVSSSSCWRGGNLYFIIKADGQSFLKSVPLKISPKSPEPQNTTEF